MMGAMSSCGGADISELRAPFPWFGGKSAVASEVWKRFGDVGNYIEPFVGSAACLLSRPMPRGFETINDFDGLLTNAWRALQADSYAVAEHADWPVSECDLHARHAWLVGQRESITARLMGDPSFYDAKAAGWWLWGISSWIGSGWCSGEGPWIVVDGELVDSRQLPHLSEGKGINRKLPHLSGDQGSEPQTPAPGQLPALTANAVQGINRQLPMLGGDSGASGNGINRAAIKRAGLLRYFSDLSNRLRDVRIACGDFERVLGPSITMAIGTTAVFLDPPYDTNAADCHDAYSVDTSGVAERARRWAVANGGNPAFRIALCGYMGEHDVEMVAAGWDAYQWKAKGGYGNQGSGRGRENAKREVVWFSPHCMAKAQASLFDTMVAA
jgi:hypothetical protein